MVLASFSTASVINPPERLQSVLDGLAGMPVGIATLAFATALVSAARRSSAHSSMTPIDTEVRKPPALRPLPAHRGKQLRAAAHRRVDAALCESWSISASGFNAGKERKCSGWEAREFSAEADLDVVAEHDVVARSSDVAPQAKHRRVLPRAC